jgi:Domain of unknown function (DUF6316)
MDDVHRPGEAPGPHFRSDRIIQVNGQWFLSTREGIEIGPYADRSAAEAAVARLATMLNGIDDPMIAAEFIRVEFNLLRREE